MMAALHPTANPDINDLLAKLLASVQEILGTHFIGMYLEGSLATDAFDQASDIDFVVVTDEEVTGELFETLRAMHDRIATIDSPWATQLEGSYISQNALRKHDPNLVMYPNIERGHGERLKMTEHGLWWDTHRVILRERGITLVGPDPKTMVDPVAPDDLRRGMAQVVDEWSAPILKDPTKIAGRGYQSYSVLTLCRMLYTLQFGTVASKLAAADWAQATLGQEWGPLIERAVAGRHDPDHEASPEDIGGTLALLRYTLAQVHAL